MSKIGILAEKSLHATLKKVLTQTGDLVETRVGRYVIDIRRDDLLIEIQTRNFSGFKRKLERLLEDYRVHVVHPIPACKWIVKLDNGREVSRRKSPKNGKLTDVFRELVYIPHLLTHPNFSLEVLLIHEEEYRVNDGQGSWRRKGWSIVDHHLLEIVDSYRFDSLEAFATLLPDTLAETFTTRDLKQALHVRQAIAGKIAYALREAGIIVQTGKQGNAYVYKRV